MKTKYDGKILGYRLQIITMNNLKDSENNLFDILDSEISDVLIYSDVRSEFGLDHQTAEQLRFMGFIFIVIFGFILLELNIWWLFNHRGI